MLLIATSWAIATLAAGPVTDFVGNHLVFAMFRTTLAFRLDGRGIAIWLAVSVVLSIAASLIPAWRAGRLTVREALSYE